MLIFSIEANEVKLYLYPQYQHDLYCRILGVLLRILFQLSRSITPDYTVKQFRFCTYCIFETCCHKVQIWFH